MVHLTNRLPLKVIGMKSLREILDNFVPKIRLRSKLIPRVFGYISYTHLNPMHNDKLSARDLKCVFVGYLNTQKGYKCYHPPIRKLIISKD